MSVQVGDQLLDGQVVILGVEDGLVTKIQFPSIKDTFGRPLEITFNPGQAVENITIFAQSVIDLLG